MLDDVDQCPTKAEDADEFDDADGCPISTTIPMAWSTPPTRARSTPRPATAGRTTMAARIESHPRARRHRLRAVLARRSTVRRRRCSSARTSILKENPELFVEMSGHTSMEGLPERNLDLSLRRAQAVKAYLVRRGIEDRRILTVGHGSDVPIADNNTEDGRRRNRRIEFRILRPDEMP